MIKLLVFDLDSTLAPIGKKMGEEEVLLLHKLEQKGIRIAICSGKTCDYLCGFMRQIGLSDPILIGENGAMIRFGVDLPPRKHYNVPFSEKAEVSLKRVREILDQHFPNLWYQPNQVEVTPFPDRPGLLDEIGKCMEKYKEDLEGLVIHRQPDCFDFVPEGMDKATGVSYLLKLLNMKPEEFIAIGDGVNDYGMFALAGFSVGVNVREAHRVNKNFSTTKDMLIYLNELLR